MKSATGRAAAAAIAGAMAWVCTAQSAFADLVLGPGPIDREVARGKDATRVAVQQVADSANHLGNAVIPVVAVVLGVLVGLAAILLVKVRRAAPRDDRPDE